MTACPIAGQKAGFRRPRTTLMCALSAAHVIALAGLSAGCSAPPSESSGSEAGQENGPENDASAMRGANARSLASVRARFGGLERDGGVSALVREPGSEALVPTLRDTSQAKATRALIRFEPAGTTIVDQATGVGVAFALADSEESQLTLDDGFIVAAAQGASPMTVYRATTRGLEDYVVLDAPPTGGLSYTFEPLGARALRLVDGTLELLDGYGAPRIRVRRPYVIDKDGVRHSGTLRVDGCAVDSDARAPWGRALVELDAARCTLTVSYDASIPHPVLVDPEWQVAAFMDNARTHHSATLLPDKTVLVLGGFDTTGAALGATEILCPEAFDCGGSVTFATGAPMPGARGAHSEALLSASGKILVSGGRATRASTTGLQSADVYDIASGSWASAGNMSVGRWGHSSTTLNDGRVLVAAGEDGTAASTAQIYDPALGFNTPAFAMSGQHRRGHVAELLNDGKVLVAGGIGSIGNTAVASAELFDPTTGAFTALASQMSAPRAFATATRLEDAQGRVLIVGGTNNVGFYSQTIDLFLPSAGGGSFQQTFVAMAQPRAFHTATKLIGEQKVLIAGGFDGTTIQDEAEVYDQTAGPSMTGDFVPLLSTTMTRGHDFHSATRLPSGKVVVIGGGVGGTPTAPGSGAVDIIAASQAEILARVNGEPCDFDGECLSNHCYEAPNGICCNESCTDVCASCRAAEQAIIPPDTVVPGDGVCSIVLDHTPVNPQCASNVQLVLECTNGEVDLTGVDPCIGYVCDPATDQCAKTCANDAGCQDDYFCTAPNCLEALPDGDPTCKRDAQCLSDHCVDGVCCNSACDGQCQACDLLGFEGTCTQVEGEGPRGERPACEGAGGDCEGICGANPLKCDYDKTKTCGASQCDEGTRNFGLCSLETEGVCAPTTKLCEPFACDTAGEACVVECKEARDCATGAVCRSDGTCAVVEDAECFDDHTVADPAGTQTDCTPLKCKENHCVELCASIDDCVDGFVCDQSGACIEPPADPPPPEDCSASAARRSSSGSLPLGVALAALGLFSRRRRPSRTSAEARR